MALLMHYGEWSGRVIVFRAQQGSVYIWLLLALTILALGLGRWAEDYAIVSQRSKEADLLRIGQSYQIALDEYYQNSQGSLKIYPNELKDLLKDPRTLRVKRYLRKLEHDPITEKPFEIIRGDDGGIVGVFSQSAQQPIKQMNFPTGLEKFNHAQHYKDWVFRANSAQEK